VIPSRPTPKVRVCPLCEPWGAALRFGQQFEQTTPMLVMPFSVFKAQGRIMKSVKVWRDQALAAGSLVVHEEGSGKVVIFISHTWWDRAFKDATNDPKNPYDKGAPDWQDDYPEEQRRNGDYELVGGQVVKKMVTYQRPKDLKWRVICAGVQRLIEQEGLKEEDVSLWVDWQSIYQDDEAEKLKGVISLIRYATLCQYMLVHADRRGGARWLCDQLYLVHPCLRKPRLVVSHHPPHHPPPLCPPACTGAPKAPLVHTHQHAALARPRSRIEYFVFGLLAEMQGHEVQLYAILLDGALNRYPKVRVLDQDEMPSGGALANPKDKALVTGLEDKMIEAYGTALVEVKCKAAGGGQVDLSCKMLRPQHVGALFAAVERYKVADLNLRKNQLGAAGGALVAAALATNTTLTELECAQLGQPLEPRARVGCLAGGPHTLPALALLILASPFAQARRQQPRPRGWHGARRGPQEQHHPHGAPVCCALPSNPPTHALRPHSMHARCTGPLYFFLRRVRSLGYNDLGPEAGMALAEALKSNTTLTEPVSSE
jgi:hypothetical protein